MTKTTAKMMRWLTERREPEPNMTLDELVQSSYYLSYLSWRAAERQRRNNAPQLGGQSPLSGREPMLGGKAKR